MTFRRVLLTVATAAAPAGVPDRAQDHIAHAGADHDHYIDSGGLFSTIFPFCVKKDLPAPFDTERSFVVIFLPQPDDLDDTLSLVAGRCV